MQHHHVPLHRTGSGVRGLGSAEGWIGADRQVKEQTKRSPEVSEDSGPGGESQVMNIPLLSAHISAAGSDVSTDSVQEGEAAGGPPAAALQSQPAPPAGVEHQTE